MKGARRPGRRALVRHAGFRVAIALLSVVTVCALVPQWVVRLEPGAPSPIACSLRDADGEYQDRLPPSGAHWFGTDAQGCDVFSRVVHGARNSLAIGVGATVLTTLLGVALGMAAGWRGGWTDAVVRRVGDVVLGVPVVVGLILLLSVLVGGQRTAMHIVVAFTSLLWPTVARITRQATMAIKPQPFIEAARALGAGDLSICVRHVLPNALPAIVAYATTMVGLLIGTEAVLSFLGVGLQSPEVSWGLMIDAAQVHYATDPSLVLFPGAFLAAAVAGFILLGDAIGEHGDHRRSADRP